MRNHRHRWSALLASGARVLLFLIPLSIAWAGDTCQVVIISQSGRPDFLKSVEAGAQNAAGEPGAQNLRISFLPAQQSKSADEQVAAVESATTGGVNGIILAPLDHDALVAPVAKAMDKKIAVVAIDSSVSLPSIPEVAGDNHEEGRMAARELAKLMNGKGNAVLLRNQINSANTEAREEGFQEIIRTTFPGIHLVATDFHAGSSVETAQRVSNAILGLHKGEVDGVFASSQIGTLGMLAALRQAGLNGKVKLIGFDEGDPSLPLAMKQGDVQGLVTQDSFAMGYAAVKALAAMLHGEKNETAASIPFRLMTPAGAVLPSPPSPVTAAITTAKSVPVARNTSLSGEDFAVPGLGLIMVAVSPPKAAVAAPAAPSDKPAVTEKFWLGRYELTQTEWTAVMGSNPSDFHGADLPVDNVSWNNAIDFCQKLTERERDAGRLPKGYVYTLPTEAQWDYACRAGSTDAYGGNADDVGWSADNSGAIDAQTGIWRMTTHPVGQKLPNAWSFCDMHGNVAEWCLEPYTDHPGEAPSRDKSGKPYRILRGGAWWTDVQNCGTDSRHKAPADRHHSGLGLRVALSPVTP